VERADDRNYKMELMVQQYWTAELIWWNISKLHLLWYIELPQLCRMESKTISTPYYHVDVFSPQPFSGNGLIVFTEADHFSDAAMQTLTQEMRQFESIFLQDIRGNTVRARIFTCLEELNFAGHPVLGAAATLHDLLKQDVVQASWVFELNQKSVTVTTERQAYGYDAVMNQGKAVFGRVLSPEESADILSFIGAVPDDLYPGLYPTVVSTGLPYLVVPLKDNGYKARIGAPGLEERLHAYGAQFIGLLDIGSRGIRTGNNDGSVEDIATGSLAGPSGAYLVAHGLEQAGTVIGFQQGRNLGRDSKLYVTLAPCSDGSMDVMVRGGVCKIARGVVEAGFDTFV
jgi:trans-2,3-dihydro-3-hydroxyanthranilate isomerase